MGKIGKTFIKELMYRYDSKQIEDISIALQKFSLKVGYAKVNDSLTLQIRMCLATKVWAVD